MSASAGDQPNRGAMDAKTLRALQSPLKRMYREDPEAALQTSHAEGELGPDVTCAVSGWSGKTVTGLHASTGGDGSKACSADLLLEALVGCAGVTLNSVATVLGIDLRRARISADGKWDARGTLGVDREAPVGLTDITLTFELETDADAETKARLVELTERYCVIAQTLRHPPRLAWKLSG